MFNKTKPTGNVPKTLDTQEKKWMIANRYRETNGNPTWEIKQGGK